MKKVLNKSAITKTVIDNAASMLERADLAQLLGDEMADELESNYDLQSFAERIQKQVAATIRKIVVRNICPRSSLLKMDCSDFPSAEEFGLGKKEKK